MRSGPTQYKVSSLSRPGESAAGTLVSNERSLVNQLCEHFSIQVRGRGAAERCRRAGFARETLIVPMRRPQVHNPLVIMTQDATKEMVTGTPEDKFKVRAAGPAGPRAALLWPVAGVAPPSGAPAPPLTLPSCL